MEIFYKLLIPRSILTFFVFLTSNLYSLLYSYLQRLCFCAFLFLGALHAVAQPVITTQPSNFPTTCQPNSNTTFSITQPVVVNKCSNSNSMTFQWQYNNGSAWVPVSDNSPVGFQTYTVTSSSANGTSSLAVTLNASASIGTFQFRVVATVDKCTGNSPTFVASNPITFTVNPKPVPTFTSQGTTTGCINSVHTYSTQGGQSGYLWSVPGIQNTDYAIVSGSVGSTSNTVTLRWLTSGSKTVGINYSNGSGCTASTSTFSNSTDITAAPSPTFTAGSATACTGTDVTYTTQAGFSNYIWTFSGLPEDYFVISGGTSASNTVTLRWLSSGNKIVTVNYSNANGCEATNAASYATSVNAVPAATFTTSPGATTCVSNSVTYTTQSGQSSYLWSVSGILNTDYIISEGGLGSADNTVTLQWITTGPKTVTVNYNNTSGCTATTPATSNTTVSFAAVPQISASGPLTFCDGGSVTLTSDAATSYQWYLNGNPIVGATAQSYIADSAGDYVVRVTNEAGCEAASATMSVTENALPDITVSAQASSLCFSSSAQTSGLNYTNTNGSPTTYSITWTGTAPSVGFADISNAMLPLGSIPIAVPANAPGNTTYTGNLTVSNANGCISTVKSFTVSITSPPNVTDFNLLAAAGCTGTGAVITVNSGSILNGTYTITYNLSGANNATESTASMVFNSGSGTFLANALNEGATEITVTQLALVGCSTPVNLNNVAQITINPLPAVAVITGPTSICAGSTALLENATPGGVWSTSEPSIATVSPTGEITALLPGSVVITYTTSPDGNSCTNSATFNLTINALPEIQAITGSRNLCVNSSSTLENATPGGIWTSSIPAVATIDVTSGVVTTHDVGTTIITYTTATDEQGCSSSTSVTVSVEPPPTIVAGTELEVCESATPVAMTLGGASFGGSATSATWVIVDGGGTLSNVGPTTEPANVTYTPAANFSGTVTLSLVSNALNSCTPVSEQRLINVTSKPVVSAGDAITICQSANPSAIALSGSSISAGATMGTWSVSGGGTLSNTSSTSEPALVTYTPEANFTGTVILTLTSNASGSCEVVSATRTINVTAPPTAVAGADLSTCGTGVAVNISGGASATNYTSLTWQTSGSGSFTNITSLTDGMYTPSDEDIIAGSVTITLRVNGGACEDAVASKTLNITPAATAIAGTDITVCAAPGAVNITAGSSATNASVVLWTSNGTGTISDPSSLTAAAYTPAVGETGTITLTLTATGNSPCSNAVSTKSIIINPDAAITLTSAAATAAQTVCLNTAITAITYSITGGGTDATFTGLPVGVTGVFANGIVTINGTPTVAGAFTYTVNTTGSCAQTSLSGTINVSAVTAGGVISPALVTGCSGTINGSITLNNSIGNVIQWESSINGGATWAIINNTGLTQSYSGLAQTTIYRALVQSVNCPSAYSAISVVSVVPKFNPTALATPTAICVGQSSVLSSTTGYPTPGISDESGSFSNANPTGWRRDGQTTGDFLPANGDNTANGVWRETNNHTFNGISYSSTGKFAIVSGPFTSVLETPVFSLIAQNNLNFEFLQAYNLFAGTTAFIEISTDGGNTYPEILAQYNGASPTSTKYGISGTTGTLQPTSFSLANYIGLSNLRIRFRYQGTANSSWALDNVRVPAVLPITYAWTSNPASTFGDPTLGSVTVSPTVTTIYTLTTMVNGCDAGSTTVTVTVNPLPTLALGGTLTSGTVITCFGSTTAPLPYTGTDLPTGSRYNLVWSAAANTAGFINITDGALPATPISLALPVGVLAGTYTGTIAVRNTNGCAGAAVPFSLIVNPAPTLGSVTAAPLCNINEPTSLTVSLTGLLPNSTSTIIYRIGGAPAVTASGISADGSGNGSFQVSVTGASDGQSLAITSISSTTSNSISCAMTPTTNNTLVLIVKSGYVWTGGAGVPINNWSNPLNWLCGVPADGASVVIPQVANGNFPRLDVSFRSNNFELLGNATIELDIHTLTLGTLGLPGISTIRNEGSIIGSRSASLIINGALSESLKFVQTTVGSTNALLNFTLNSGQTATLGNALWVVGNANPASGVIASNGNLTMVSTKTTSSNITQTTAPSNVDGIVNVQSYVAGEGITNVPTRGFVSMSSPINDALLAAGNKTYKQMQEYVIITGPGGTANGFDQGGVQQPFAETITTYNEPAAPLSPSSPSIATINDANIPGTGFLLFFRGTQGGSYPANSNKLNAPFVTPDPATITFRGVINKFNLAPTVLSHTNYGDRFDGFNLIGNPYPSAIDWVELYKSKSSNAVLDEFIIVLPGGKQASYLNGATNNTTTTIIQPAQGFYVVTTSNGESLTFTESVKSTIYPARLLTAPKEVIMSADKMSFSGRNEVKEASKKLVRLRLEDDLDNDETTLVFQESGSMLAGHEDALNFSSGRVSLSSLSSDNIRMAINGLPDLEQVKEVRLNVNGATSKEVKLNFTDLSQTQGYEVYLKDSLLGKLVDVKLNPIYSFTIDKTRLETYGNLRFSIVFKKEEIYPLELKAFDAKKQNEVVVLSWEVEAKGNAEEFLVEQSADGQTFHSLGSVRSQGNTKGSEKYYFTDKDPVRGINYYRIRQIHLNGRESLSEIKSIDYFKENKGLNTMTVFPNPANEMLEAIMDDRPNEAVELNVFNMQGKNVLNATFSAAERWKYNISMLQPSIYIIEVKSNKTSKILGRAKFVKGN